MKHTAKHRRTTAALAVAGLIGAGSIGMAAPAAAQPAAAKAPGEVSLAEVLNADGNRFDRNWDDFDIVHRAVTTVLAADPTSPVAVLADGGEALTAFVPTDRAFRRLVRDLTGKTVKTEKEVFNTVAGAVGVEGVEDVLLYHVVPGATITSEQALQADGATLMAASGQPIKVRVNGSNIRLVDLDHDDWNPRVKIVDINAGNLQIAHGINAVLRPADLD